MPEVGIVKQAKCDTQLFENGIADLVVKNPTAANYMCCFQPCNETQMLQVFEADPDKFSA